MSVSEHMYYIVRQQDGEIMDRDGCFGKGGAPKVYSLLQAAIRRARELKKWYPKCDYYLMDENGLEADPNELG